MAEISKPDEPLSLQQAELELSRYLHKPLEYRYLAEVAVELCARGYRG